MYRKDVIDQAVAVLRALAEREEQMNEQRSAGRWIETVDGEILWWEAWEDEANEPEQGKGRYRPLARKAKGYTPQSQPGKPPQTKPIEQKLIATSEQERKQLERKVGVRLPMKEDVLVARAADPLGAKYYDPPKQTASQRLERSLDAMRV